MGEGAGSVGAVFFHFLGGDGLAVHGVPHVGYVAGHEGDNHRHDAHHREGELARRAIVDAQGA